MASRADMRKVGMALFATASILVGFLIMGMHPQNPSQEQWWTCTMDGGPGDEPPAPEATALMLMTAFSFAVFSWCCLAVLAPQHQHTTRELIRSFSDLSVGFTVVAGIAAVDTMIDLGPFWRSRLQVAGGRWTFLVVIVATYAVSVFRAWKALRSLAMSRISIQQTQPVGITAETTVNHGDPAASGPTYAAQNPPSGTGSVSFLSVPPLPVLMAVSPLVTSEP